MKNTSPGAQSSAKTAPLQSGSNTLPVISLCNNLITLSSYLSAINNAQLPASVTSSNPTLATLLEQWQDEVWNGYMIALQNEGILAEAEEMNDLIGEGITTQSVFQTVVNPTSGPVPIVISLCDNLTSLVSGGNALLNQIQTVITGIENYDQSQIANLNSIISTLNTQFDSMEDQLTEKALDDMKEVFVTIVNVGVDVATEEDPIEPLVDGVAQVASNTVTELVLSSEIQATLSDLESAWSQLDTITAEYAQLVTLQNQINTVITDGSDVLNALNNIVTDWQTIVDAVNCAPADWTSTYFPMVQEWAARMVRINWPAPVVQIV